MQVDLKTLKKDVIEYRELYEKKAKDFDELVMKNEQQKKKEAEQLPVTHFTEKVKLEDAMKTLQAALGDFRASYQEILSYSVHVVRINGYVT